MTFADLKERLSHFNGGKLWREAKVYYGTLLHPPPAQQAGDKAAEYTNRWSEASKASPYWAGHIDQFAQPWFYLTILTAICLLAAKCAE